MGRRDERTYVVFETPPGAERGKSEIRQQGQRSPRQAALSWKFRSSPGWGRKEKKGVQGFWVFLNFILFLFIYFFIQQVLTSEKVLT